MRYDRRASVNEMNRTWNFQTNKVQTTLRREAKAWRQELIDLVAPFKGKFGKDTKVTLQIMNKGGQRGDTSNYEKLTCDAIATALNLPSDAKFSVHSLPRIKVDVPVTYLSIILENDNEGEDQVVSHDSLS